jgi:uncharacterized protein YkuJ
MKKTLLLVIIATLSIFILVSCGKEDVPLANPDGKPIDPNANGNNGNPNPNPTAKKCYVNEILFVDDEEKYTAKFTYNSKNLLETKVEGESSTSYQYDTNNRLTKMAISEDGGVELFMYDYDEKGNILKVKYSSEGKPFTITWSEFVYTTNTKGQVEKIQVKTEEGPADYLFEYDGSNIKKVMVSNGTKKLTFIENLKFDTQSNVYLNTNLSKAYLPHILMGTIFGVNMTHFFNANNILSAKVTDFTGGVETSTYNYGYNAEGYPSKMNAVRVYDGDTTKEEQNYTYSCK